MNQEGDNEVWLPGSSSSRRALLTTLDWFDLEQRIGLKSVAEAMFRPEQFELDTSLMQDVLDRNHQPQRPKYLEFKQITEDILATDH